MGARTTCRVFKSDNMLLLYFKLIFTTTHHFQLFGGRIEKPDVNLLLTLFLHTFSKFSILWPRYRYRSPGQSGRSTSPKPAVFCTSMQTSAFTNALEVLKLLWLRWVPIVLKRFIQRWFKVYRVRSTIFFLLKFCPPSGPNIPEVGFTACSFPQSHWRLLRNCGVVSPMDQSQVLYYGCCEKQRSWSCIGGT